MFNPSRFEPSQTSSTSLYEGAEQTFHSSRVTDLNFKKIAILKNGSDNQIGWLMVLSEDYLISVSYNSLSLWNTKNSNFVIVFS